jgi:hypothetical protein
LSKYKSTRVRGAAGRNSKADRRFHKGKLAQNPSFPTILNQFSKGNLVNARVHTHVHLTPTLSYT